MEHVGDNVVCIRTVSTGQQRRAAQSRSKQSSRREGWDTQSQVLSELVCAISPMLPPLSCAPVAINLGRGRFYVGAAVLGVQGRGGGPSRLAAHAARARTPGNRRYIQSQASLASLQQQASNLPTSCRHLHLVVANFEALTNRSPNPPRRTRTHPSPQMFAVGTAHNHEPSHRAGPAFSPTNPQLRPARSPRRARQVSARPVSQQGQHPQGRARDCPHLCMFTSCL